jgi:hypothetical protein
MILSIDRAGRALDELVAFLQVCLAAGAEIYTHARRTAREHS